MSNTILAADGRVQPLALFEVSNKDSKHFVVASLDLTTDQLKISCGHKWISGKATKPSKLSKDDAYFATSTFATHGIEPKAEACEEAIDLALSGSAPECAHVKAVHTFLEGEKLTDFVVETKHMALQGAKVEGLKVHLHNLIKSMTSAGDQKEVSMEDAAFKTPILLLGSAGSGKTIFGHAVAESQGAYLEKISCFEGIRPHDILGHVTEAFDGRKGWQDKPLSRAFRLAFRGHKVVILIDEINRPDARIQALFLGAMTRTLHGTYMLDTGRCFHDPEDEGILYSERLEVPCENLCFIATGNVGDDYDVSDLDPAFKDRFGWVKVLNSELATLKKVLKLNKVDEITSEKVIRFWKETNKPQIKSKLSLAPSVRAMDKVLSEYGGNIKGALLGQIDKWVELVDGSPDPEMKKYLTDLIVTL